MFQGSGTLETQPTDPTMSVAEAQDAYDRAKADLEKADAELSAAQEDIPKSVKLSPPPVGIETRYQEALREANAAQIAFNKANADLYEAKLKARGYDPALSPRSLREITPRTTADVDPNNPNSIAELTAENINREL